MEHNLQQEQEKCLICLAMWQRSIQLMVTVMKLTLFPDLLVTMGLYFVYHGQVMDLNWFPHLMTAGEVTNMLWNDG